MLVQSVDQEVFKLEAWKTLNAILFPFIIEWHKNFFEYVTKYFKMCSLNVILPAHSLEF